MSQSEAVSPASYINKNSCLAWLVWTGLALIYFYWPAHHDYYCDEGYIAEMTARVLRGEWPNLDFASNYMGLFYFWNAGWFIALGKSLLSLKLAQYSVVSILFIPTAYGLARLHLNRLWASLSTLLVMALTISANTSVSGNWLALFLATASAYLFIREVSRCQQNTSARADTKQLLKSGLWLGLSCLIKHTIAIYTGVAFLIYLCYFPIVSQKTVSAGHRKSDKLITSGLLAGFYFLILWMFRTHLHWFYFVFQLIPLGFMMITAIRAQSKHTSEKAPVLFTLWPVITSTALCVGLYLLVCLFTHGISGMSTLLHALLIDYPAIYLENAFLPYYQMLDWHGWIPLGWAGLLIFLLNKNNPKLALLFFVMGLGSILIQPAWLTWNQTTYWFLSLPPTLILLGLIRYKNILFSLGSNNSLDLLATTEDGDQVKPVENTDYSKYTLLIFLWIWGVLLFLNTYPLGMMFYCAYTMLPLALLMAAWLYHWSVNNKARQLFSFVLIGFWILYGVLMAYRQIGWSQTADTPLFPRYALNRWLADNGQVWITQDFDDFFNAELRFIHQYSTRPDDVFLFTDNPTMYFLTDHINSTRYSYAIDSRLSDGQDIIDGLERHQVQWVIVRRNDNHFEQPLLQIYLQDHFRQSVPVASDIVAYHRSH